MSDSEHEVADSRILLDFEIAALEESSDLGLDLGSETMDLPDSNQIHINEEQFDRNELNLDKNNVGGFITKLNTN